MGASLLKGHLRIRAIVTLVENKRRRQEVIKERSKVKTTLFGIDTEK